ncbi:MAG TPA: D-cysteine desulfhydrase family protein [Thermomicrobiales bacterium]|nr:D-cysteine desulfhydrase family protein [Thermomicrobiales bacterium]
MRLDSLPRLPLAHLPTPLEPAPRLTAALGGPPIYVKRDDLTGLALGGNKARKLEYLLADAQRLGATTVITTGSTQSNHCRQTAAGARVAGLRCVLVLDAPTPDPPLQGNYLLDRLLGAEIRLVGGEAEREPALAEVAADLRRRGEVPYVIPGGGSNPLGAAAYVAAVFEVVEQLRAAGWVARHLYATSSTSGGTHAGLALGQRLADAPFDVVGIAIEDDAAAVRRVVTPLANATAEFLDAAVRLAPDDLVVDDRFVGPGYAIPTPECLAAIGLAARTEGLLLDPIYTGKTLAGLIDHVRTGRLGPDEPVIFLHSGGVPALFAQAGELGPALLP